MSKCPEEMQRLQLLSPEPQQAPKFPKCLECTPTMASARRSGPCSGLGTQEHTQDECRSAEQGPQRHIIDSNTSDYYHSSYLRKNENFVGFPYTYWWGEGGRFSGGTNGKKKNPLANAGDIRDTGLIPESGRSSGGGHGNPLQYFCLESPMDRGSWTTVHRVTKNHNQLKQLSTHTNLFYYFLQNS